MHAQHRNFTISTNKRTSANDHQPNRLYQTNKLSTSVTVVVLIVTNVAMLSFVFVLN